MKTKINTLDFLQIPLRNAPGIVIVLVFNSIVGALVPAFQVLIIARFLENAIAVANGMLEYTSIFLPFTLLSVSIVYSHLGSVFNNLLTLRLSLTVREFAKLSSVEKRGRLAYENLESNETWELIKRVCTDMDTRIMNGFRTILDLTGLILRIGSILLVLIAQVWWIPFAIVSFAVPLFIIALRSGRLQYDTYKNAAKDTRIAEYLKNVLIGRENVEERTLFSYSQVINKLWYEQFETARKKVVKSRILSYIRMKLSGSVVLLISFLISGILIIPLYNQKIDIGMFIALVNATFSLVNMMSWSISDIMRNLAESREYAKDMSQFYQLSETSDPLEAPDKNTYASGSIRIEFMNVSFRYPDTDRYIIKDLSVVFEPNKHYAIVGENGAGKSTLTKLLTGLYDEYEGAIMINGRERRAYTQSELKGLFSVVYQDFAKYQMSIRDNVAISRISQDSSAAIADGAILDTLRQVGMDEKAISYPMGLDTCLGKITSDSVDFSGGEWQKLVIARAIFNRAKIRILDEPTASIDPVTESEIYDLFSNISKDILTILITHRLGAARLADEIIVIQDGHVVEQGSHESLLQMNGPYYEMFIIQGSWYNDYEKS